MFIGSGAILVRLTLEQVDGMQIRKLWYILARKAQGRYIPWQFVEWQILSRKSSQYEAAPYCV
ncbi:uncharacterized protein CANTADRAFT_88043 [Suhomyces tanzawaensis NRRL Y-17324]|uniref:Uncharacterized protein n=1 Tax=Suhomyces tanzawaensis NRRL Y-17324 TaxID=984487 RepID=A0A1E4SRI0_9ASCO|nr:uncharacterized protein CANTADRAFT_88043 [Suhomyces tanzawaensis NRRL Y-17324]ODV82111.1 hypothetical protein CANTADRAFT_88043 [Suhomyces tanzawaensis NRRL Y-17324]